MHASNGSLFKRQVARQNALTRTATDAMIAFGIFMLALVPRTILVGSFVTVDEAYHWLDRAAQFLAALQQRDYAGTNLIGHPGITTMWLGTIGIWIERALAALGWIAANDPNMYRTLLRLPVGIVTAVCVGLAYPLLRQLFGRRVALLTALLWAFDPFIIANSQLLHTDALLTSFMMLSLLTALVAFGIEQAPGEVRPVRWRLLIASGIAAGLALLTKSPAIALPPMIGLIVLVSAWRAGLLAWRRIIAPLLVWGAMMVIVWFALWPATWVDLPGVIRSVYGQAKNDGGSPHGWGNFFLGRSVADPGPLFYPVAILLRLTPWTLLGIVAGVVALARNRMRGSRRALVLLAIFALLFVTALEILPKKFDRYALPIFPTLDLFAAVGIVWLARAVSRRWSASLRFLRGPAPWVIGGIVLAVNIAWYHPYELAYYNPLLGGGPLAERVIPVGWGEGFEQVGAFITGQKVGCDRPVATWFGPTLSPYICQPIVGLDWATNPDRSGFAVLYRDQIQRNDMPDSIALLFGRAQPLATIRILGIDYAYIYQIVPPVKRPVQATFGSNIQFNGLDADLSALRTSGAITLTMQWQAAEAAAVKNRSLFIHLLDAGGQKIAQADIPLVGSYAPASDWQAGRIASWQQPLPMPANVPSNTYWLALGVYDQQDGARLPLQAQAPPGAPPDGNGALLLGPITIP